MGTKSDSTVVDVSKYIEPHDDKEVVISFAIEEHDRNTVENRYKESTNTVPILVRRVNSEELLPRPFKTTNQLLCASYLSCLCCCCCTAGATWFAWKVKQHRNSGVYTSAIKEAKKSVCFIMLAVGFGAVLWIIGISLLVLKLKGELK